MQKRSAVWSAVVVAVTLVGCSSSNNNTPDGGTGGTVIGSSSVEVDTRMVVTHVGESASGDFLVDVMDSTLKGKGKTFDVAILNAGAIRGGAVDPDTFQFLTPEGKIGRVYPAGDVTDQDVAAWLPFRNDHRIIQITGTQLKSALERGVATLPPDLRNDQGGWLLLASGMKYTITCAGTPQALNANGDAIETEGSRVTKIEVGGTVIYDSAASVDQLATTNVRVALSSFLAAGLDGHLAFNEGTVIEEIPIASYDLAAEVQAYVQANSPIAPATDGRMTVVGNCGQPLTTP